MAPVSSRGAAPKTDADRGAELVAAGVAVPVDEALHAGLHDHADPGAVLRAQVVPPRHPGRHRGRGGGAQAAGGALQGGRDPVPLLLLRTAHGPRLVTPAPAVTRRTDLSLVQVTNSRRCGRPDEVRGAEMEQVLVESSSRHRPTYPRRSGEQQRRTRAGTGPARHDPRAPSRLRRHRLRSRAAPAPRARVRPHHVGAGHRLARAPLHGDRPRPARPRGVRQAARGLQRRRLRQRHARPADRARHRPGERGGPQLRRRGGDAVRLPVPRAHRAAHPGRLRRPRARGHARRSGRSPRPASTRPWGC